MYNSHVDAQQLTGSLDFLVDAEGPARHELQSGAIPLFQNIDLVRDEAKLRERAGTNNCYFHLFLLMDCLVFLHFWYCESAKQQVAPVHASLAIRFKIIHPRFYFP